MVQLALLVAAGLVLFVFESFVPKPLPWLRLGLANVATLVALCLFGIREAFIVASMRALLGSFVVGGLLNPAFLFSLLGGLMSAASMALIYFYFKGVFSIIGVSIWGALAHNTTQLIVATTVFVRRWELMYFLPFFLVSTVATGFLTGLLVSLFMERMSGRRSIRFSVNSDM